MADDQGDEVPTMPCILVTSCDSRFKEEELIRQILGSESLPQATKIEERVSWYPWTINNKYYTANVSLCVVSSPFDMNTEVARSMQAFIVYFDSKTKNGLNSVNSWLSVVEDLAPEVLILVCDHACDSGVSKQEAQQWCLAHAFELVELNPQDLPDEDDDFPESTGVKRIVQALNANVWSSVEMKDEHSQGFGLMSSLVASHHNNPRPSQETLSSHSPSNSTDEGTESQRAENNQNNAVDTAVDPMIDIDIQELANLTAGDADVENFERLFTKLKEMKDKASSLPHDQRKVHAEKVAKAFWMAIGGDQDEIDGLSSGEES
ncbi:alpha- and gamma-adaptin-binding protein p34-like [Sinocyclocheilus rhinocerous]|uniref:Alpha- and gamma-adaptin-binding protein p34-like n=1 Tax=Sinocyclocheilus rhinocerous TaxID=307959 RepID=A0A673LL92_9TELE|nr:PREDICTED: alpha- and gamma-adaptin-binding protein p34-like [Sinocyclocheilus rhinocerous]